jgi:hypothetical protein
MPKFIRKWHEAAACFQVVFALLKNYRPAMRAVWIICCLTVSLGSAVASGPVSGRVIKLLPFLLDKQGRDSTSPSLFDRDAYQLHLRQHPKEISAIRLDVQWKAVKAPDEKLKIRVEVRGVTHDGSPTLKTFESPVVAGNFSRWSKFSLSGDEYRQFGSVVAWRATLWNGEELVGEAKSFLW